MTGNKRTKPELLAPAGSTNVFERAIAAGADAVYIGAPALNARALSKDFTPTEISAMIDYAHRRNVKLYLAANSLVKENELSQAIEMLAFLDSLQPDGLIIQDLGIYHLCRKYFPALRLHASTLFGAHNSLAVNQFGKMGFKRVVLARELTIEEIESVARASDVELEVFIHGTLCFSYSGLCLFSSYLGGKSGLRGRCVQPCRRRYRWQNKGDPPGYFFSMNDLAGLDLIHRLRAAGVSSFKIEGRLRSAHYVASVVQAYRMVIDADPADQEALREAWELLDQAMGRKTSPGYFLTTNPKDLISPDHSGNIGLYLGQAAKGSGKGILKVKLKQPLRVGDRLRLHQEQSGERVPFNLQEISIRNRRADRAGRGDLVVLEVPATVREGDSLYKVDSRSSREAEKQQSDLDIGKFSQAAKRARQEAKKRAAAIHRGLGSGMAGTGQKPVRRMRRSKGVSPDKPLLYIKIDDLQALKYRLPVMPDLLLLELNVHTLKAFQQQRKGLRKFQHKLAWSLPPVISENDLDFFRSAVAQLLKSNYRTWQIGHIGQQLFFSGRRDITLLGDYTLNILNSQGLPVLQNLGLRKTQAAVEIDRHSLKDILGSKSSASSRVELGLTIYGRPPLFTARPDAAHFMYGPPLVSPKGETFVLQRAGQSIVAMAEKPFSLLSKLPELAQMGLQYAVIDLSRLKLTKQEGEEIAREVSGRKSRRRLSAFNYNGTLL